MGKIDHPAQVENKREPQGHQHVEGADDQPVGDIEEDQTGHRATGSSELSSLQLVACMPVDLSSAN